MEMVGEKELAQVAVSPDASRNAGPKKEPRAFGTWHHSLLAIPLALIVTYAFIPILDNGFVVWDDDQNFLNNPHFRGLGITQFKWAWSTLWVGVYQPVAWLLYELQYVYCQLNPYGYHLTSLLLHVANAVVLYVLTVAVLIRSSAKAYIEGPWALAVSAGIATALFAVHPLRVEAVAWASCQPYLPCALFSMLSVLAYLYAFPHDSSPRWSAWFASFLLFVAALLSHPVPVTLPIVFLILDAYPLRRFEPRPERSTVQSARRVLLEKIPFVLTSIVFMGIAVVAKREARFPTEHFRVLDGIAQACYTIWFYIVKTVVPLDVIAYYPFPGEPHWLAFPYNVSIVATVVISVGLFLVRRRWPGVLAAWLSYLVILAPNSGFIRISDQVAADRYSYMSLLGTVPLMAAGSQWLWRTSSHRNRTGAIEIVAIGLGAVIGLTVLTRNQCRTWHDSEVLWTHAVTHGPDSNWAAHYNLGTALASRKHYEAAATQYSDALRFNPNVDILHHCLGTVLIHLGKFAEAERQFAEVIRLSPGFVDAHYNLGTILYRRGNYGGAEAQFAEAIRFRPGFAEAYNANANIMATCPDATYRNGQRAVQFATRACEVTGWNDPRFLHTMAAAEAEAGNFEAAVSFQTKTLNLVGGEREKEECRSRLLLYRTKKPYHERSPDGIPENSHP